MNPIWLNFLVDRHAILEGERVMHFGNADAEVNALATETVLCDLSHLGIILAAGEDARAFLHGQLTNDVATIEEHGAQWSGYCSPKGRLLATFLLWGAKQGFMIQLPLPLVAPVQKRLAMFVLRSKVTLEDVSHQWVRIGLAGPEAATRLRRVVNVLPASPLTTAHQPGLRIICLENDRFELVGAPEVIMPLWEELSADCIPAGANAWDWYGIQAGIPEVVEATREEFVPQMVNFDLMHGVSFRKGCYPGQEIVARTQYRGILKRRMMKAVLMIEADAPDSPPKPGDSVFSPAFGDQAAGTIVSSARRPGGGFHVLLMAQTESLRQQVLHWKSPDGPALVLEPLPYPVSFPDAA